MKKAVWNQNQNPLEKKQMIYNNFIMSNIKEEYITW